MVMVYCTYGNSAMSLLTAPVGTMCDRRPTTALGMASAAARSASL